MLIFVLTFATETNKQSIYNMQPSKIFRTGNLAELHENKVYKVRRTATSNVIEYVRKNWNGTFSVRCVGVNNAGVQFTGGVIEGLFNGRFFFQCDPDNTYNKVKDCPENLYNN